MAVFLSVSKTGRTIPRECSQFRDRECPVSMVGFTYMARTIRTRQFVTIWNKCTDDGRKQGKPNRQRNCTVVFKLQVSQNHEQGHCVQVMKLVRRVARSE